MAVSAPCTSRYDTFNPTTVDPVLRLGSAAELRSTWQARPAAVMAYLSHLVYFPPGISTTVQTSVGVSCTHYSERGAQASLSRWPGTAVLAFRGTEPGGESSRKGWRGAFAFLRNDMQANLNLRTTKLDGARVHRGFLGEVNKLWRFIETDLEALELNDPNVEVHVTGHSLGGAMATIAGILHPFASVTTFGEPRVGRRIGRAFKSAAHVRYVSGDDAVTKVPPSWFGRYEHHGTEEGIGQSTGIEPLIDHAINCYSAHL